MLFTIGVESPDKDRSHFLATAAYRELYAHAKVN